MQLDRWPGWRRAMLAGANRPSLPIQTLCNPAILLAFAPISIGIRIKKYSLLLVVVVFFWNRVPFGKMPCIGGRPIHALFGIKGILLKKLLLPNILYTIQNNTTISITTKPPNASTSHAFLWELNAEPCKITMQTLFFFVGSHAFHLYKCIGKHS